MKHKLSRARPANVAYAVRRIRISTRPCPAAYPGIFAQTPCVVPNVLSIHRDSNVIYLT